MKTIDILDLIHRGNTTKYGGERIKGKLINHRFCGFISSNLSDEYVPDYLKRLNKIDERDKWVVMQIMSVGEVSEILKSKENTCFAYGSIAILVPINVPIGDWYQVEGVVRTVLYDGTGDNCYISNMVKKNNGWFVTPFEVKDLDLDSVSETIKEYILSSAQYRLFMQPQIPKGYVPVRAFSQYFDSKIDLVQNSTPESIGISILDKSFKPEENNIIEESNTIDSEDIYTHEEGECNFQEEKKNIDNNSKASKPSDKIEWREVKYRPVERFVAVNRKEKAKKTKKYDILSNIVSLASQVRSSSLETIIDNYDLDKEDIYQDDTNEFITLIENIRSNLNRRAKGVGLSGYSVIKTYIDKQDDSLKEIGDTTLGELLLYNGVDTICDYLLGKIGIEKPVTLSLPMDDSVKESLDNILCGDVQIDYAGIYAVLLGQKVQEFKDTARLCNTAGVSFIQLVKNNPYLLILVNSELKFLTLETLANARGIHSVEEDWRLACMLNEMLKNQNGSTAFDMYQLYKTKLNYSVGKLGLRRINNENSLLSEEVKSNILVYVDSSIDKSKWFYNSSRFDENGKRELSKEELKKSIIAYVDSGLGTTYKGILYNTQMLEKDLFIFNKVYDLAHKKYKVDKEKIELAIKEFEEIKNEEFKISEELVKEGKGFKLEDLQKDAVRLIDQNVACITGPAGSGKTTTVEAMIYAIKAQNPEKEISIQFAAPTGKAAKRLQEIVGGNVKTMHSLFGVFGSNDSELLDYTEEENNFRSNNNAKIFVFDEQAMVDTNLMCKVLKKIPENAQVFFLGDKEQLVAIGDGKPFADFLRFLPTVVLKVSKRSAEGSGITGNAKNIIEHSTRGDFIELYNSPDFRIIPCADKEIPNNALEICKHHLGLKVLENGRVVTNIGVLEQDDIQIISPVTKSRYVWGCDKMNIVLQDLFNPPKYGHNSSITFGFENDMKTFRLGSRVIHTVNKYDYRHYSSVAGGKFNMTNKSKIMNGDVGYIVGIYEGKDCVEIPPKEGIETEIDGYKIKDMNKYYKEGNIIVAVKYYDVDDKKDFYILYHGIKSEYSSTDSEVVLSYTNLNYLQLAYCLTTHKMQGSEAKLVLFLLGSGMSPIFMSRNMLYTAITRAREACYLIGNIQAMERGRYFESSSARKTSLEEICM